MTFEQLIESVEFRVIQQDNGRYRLEDMQGANLGDIEQEEFNSKAAVIDRMEVYWHDYYASILEEDLEIYNYKDYGDLCEQAKEKMKTLQLDYDSLRDYICVIEALELIANPPKEWFTDENKVLEECNMTDLCYNEFNNWLEEALDYQCNIVFKETEKTDEYKQLVKQEEVNIQFVKDDDDDDFPIAVYMKLKYGTEIEYVDNITQSFYERRYK